MSGNAVFHVFVYLSNNYAWQNVGYVLFCKVVSKLGLHRDFVLKRLYEFDVTEGFLMEC